MATPTDTSAADAKAAVTGRPVKPDADAFNAELEKRNKEIEALEKQRTEINEKLNNAKPNSDSPLDQRRKELIARAKEIRQKQGEGKNARTSKLDEVKRLDEQLRSRIAEQKTARSKVSYKSVEEIDQKIARLEQDVNRGDMKLVDEKKALAEVSSLRKLKKTFGQFDDGQKHIDDLRNKIKAIKDGLDNPEAKALSEEYTKIQTELDAIKAEQDELYKNLNSIRDQRTKLKGQIDEKYTDLKKFKDEYYTQKKAHAAYDRELREKRRKQQQAERDQIAKERRLARAHEMLTEASYPAFSEELRRANNLLHFFDPSHPVAEKAPLVADKGLGAQATRKVDDSGLKGMRLVRKEDREEDYLPAVKKGKKGKKQGGDAAAAVKFSCPPSVMEDCSFINVNPPMSAAEVPAVAEKVKAKIEQWKKDQDEQTRKNIEKAKKEIARLEAEESGAETPDTPTEKKDGDVVAKLEKTTLEDVSPEATKEAAATA